MIINNVKKRPVSTIIIVKKDNTFKEQIIHVQGLMKIHIKVNFSELVSTVQVYQSVCWKALCASRALTVLLVCV